MANLVHFLQYVALKQYFDMQAQKMVRTAHAAVRTHPVIATSTRPVLRGAGTDRRRGGHVQAE